MADRHRNKNVGVWFCSKVTDNILRKRCAEVLGGGIELCAWLVCSWAAASLQHRDTVGLGTGGMQDQSATPTLKKTLPWLQVSGWVYMKLTNAKQIAQLGL